MIRSSRNARFKSLSGFQRKATRAKPGTHSFKISSRLPMRSGPKNRISGDISASSGQDSSQNLLSPDHQIPSALTIEIVVVACWAARVAGEPYTTMTSAGSEASSSAALFNRSTLPSADRYSMAIF